MWHANSPTENVVSQVYVQSPTHMKQWQRPITPVTPSLSEMRIKIHNFHRDSSATPRDLSPSFGPSFCPADFSEDAFREDTPPHIVNMHWVPDAPMITGGYDESFERLALKHPYGWLSPTSESLSPSLSGLPDLVGGSISPSLSARPQSLSPHFSPTASPQVPPDDEDHPSPRMDENKDSSWSLGERDARQQTLADFTEMNTLAEFARKDTVSRFLQKEIRYASREERQRALDQILPEVVSLSCDSHGNYVVQKFVEHGHPEQRAQICKAILGDIWEMSQHSFGCRVVQKVIEYGDVSSKIKILEHLTTRLYECICNDNGNYVVQKLIAELPAHMLEPIYVVFRDPGRVYEFCKHPYGCRIVQRLLGNGSPEFTKVLCDVILAHASELARHSWGNYVIQYILESEKPAVVKKLTKMLMEDLALLACDQLASNVMEKAIQKAGPVLVGQYFNKFISRKNEELIELMNHQYGNFVVGTLLQKADNQQVYSKLYKRLKRFCLIQEIKNNKFGRHVWGKLVEKLRRNF